MRVRPLAHKSHKCRDFKKTRKTAAEMALQEESLGDQSTCVERNWTCGIAHALAGISVIYAGMSKHG